MRISSLHISVAALLASHNTASVVASSQRSSCHTPDETGANTFGTREGTLRRRRSELIA